jgi:hypothetical protein
MMAAFPLKGGVGRQGSSAIPYARRNGRACASLTARGGGLPIGVTVVQFERSSMTQDKKEKYAREYITTTRQHFSTYHNHKEQMAYIITVLYITIATALITQKDPEWANMFANWYAKTVIAAYSVLSLVFVWWQLTMRKFAADIIAACDSLRIQWLKQFPSDLDVSPTRYKNRELPAFLKKAIVTDSSDL